MNRPRWLIPVAIVAGVILLVVLPLVGAYNALVGQEAAVDRSFADLDAQLQRRNDLIPNLVSAVRGALKQERAIFRDITNARAQYAGARTIEQKAQASVVVESALTRLLAIFEDNPELRANENVRDLQVQLEGTENRVAQARRDYNQAATEYNVKIRQFPRNIIAGIFGFDRKPLFEAAAGARDAPSVDVESNLTPEP